MSDTRNILKRVVEEINKCIETTVNDKEFKDLKDYLIKTLCNAALQELKGNQSKAAATLKINRGTFRKHIKR